MDQLTWIKSSYSGGSGGNCVEVAILPDGGRMIRDSKNSDGPAVRLRRGMAGVSRETG